MGKLKYLSLSFLFFIFCSPLHYSWADDTGGDTSLLVSSPRSIHTYVADGGTGGEDSDRAIAFRDFAYSGGTVNLKINYRAAVHTDAPDAWGGACSTTDLRVRCFNAAEVEIGLYIYCLSCCRSNTLSDNYRTGNVKYILPAGITRDADGDIHLVPATWYALDVTPSTDLAINWAQVAKVRVELTAGGAFMHEDAIDVYWDDLILTLGSNTITDRLDAAPWTFSHARPSADSTWIATFYPDAPAGPYTVTLLDPDPNPETSGVMAGGKVYRYYMVKDSGGNPAFARVGVQGGGNTQYSSSDENGLLLLELDSDLLGSAGATVQCYITTVEDATLADSIAFPVSIRPRESTAAYKFGSGVNVAAAIGFGATVGEKRGFAYKILQAADEQIGIEKSREMEAGVTVGASVGGGVSGVCYAEAGAEAGISAVFSATTNYLFDDPYCDEQKILRAGLILISVFENVAPPFAGSLITWLVNNYNPLFANYWDGQEFAAGAKVYGSAEAGAGLGLGDDDSVLLGVGIGAGIEGEAQLLVKLSTSSGESGAGIVFSGSLNLSAGAQAGVVGNKVAAGLQGTLAGEYEIMLYFNGATINRAEISFSGVKDWGIGVSGAIEGGTDSTSKTVLMLTGDQVAAVLATFADIANLSNYIKLNEGSTIVLGADRLEAAFVDLFNQLSTMPISYQVIQETGAGFEFSPSLELALGFKIEVGFSIAMQKSVEFVEEEGIILGSETYKLASYGFDSHVPSVGSLNFTTVAEDCVDGVVTAMCDIGDLVVDTVTDVIIPAVEDGAETVVDVVVDIVTAGYDLGVTLINTGIDTLSGAFDDVVDLFGKGPVGLASTKSNTPFAAGEFAPNGVFMFRPEGLSIADMAALLTEPLTLAFRKGAIVIQPQAVSAPLAINYTDLEITGLTESDLRIFQWNPATKKWRFLDTSIVDTVNNRVTATITDLGSFCIGVTFPAGAIIMSASPSDVDTAAPATITVTSNPIKLNTGQAAPDGTLATVACFRRNGTDETSFGAIITPDAAPDIDGLQVATHDGVITFQITPPAAAGQGIIRAATVGGLARGKTYFNVVANLDGDGNGLPDYWEKVRFGAIGQDPAGDPDDDDLSNLQEYQRGTDPNKSDTDGDGMTDGWEVDHGLNPLLNDGSFDPDQDGLNNLAEYSAGSDPHNTDSDGDGMGDGWEVDHGLNPVVNDSSVDSDGDGLTGAQEFTHGTDPAKFDTDGDGMDDGWEVQNGLNPLLADGHTDSDGDGYSNAEEYACGTQAGDPDSHPGYAAGCWPMYRRTSFHTGAASFFGPLQGTVKWRFPGGRTWSSPAVGPDGTIYYGDYDYGALRAIHPDGTGYWAVGGYGPIRSSPAVAADGTIYAGAWNGSLLAYYPDGILRWECPTGAVIDLAPPVIGNDGTIYVGNDGGQLWAINPDGTARWISPYQTGNTIWSAPAIGRDGTIYVGSNDGNLHAVNPDGTGKWTFPTGAAFYTCSPAVGPDGTIYITTNGALAYAVNPAGTEKWRFAVGATWGSPAVGPDGTVYVPGWDYLFALNPNGTEKWRVAIAQPLSPAVAGDGLVFAASRSWQAGYGISSTGSILWGVAFGYDQWASFSPAIGPDGTVYFTSSFGSGSSGILHAFTGQNCLGDIDEDGDVDIEDIILALRMSLDMPVGLSTRTWFAPYPTRTALRSDLNADVNTNIIDIILLLRKVLGW